MAEELSRKRRQRGGHRSSATSFISSAIEVLVTGDVSQFAKHAVKLNQQRASLQQKQITHRQLDAEILALVDEDEIEAEIERADLVEENIQLPIANIDNALSSNANANAVVSNQSAQSPVEPSTLIKALVELLQRKISLNNKYTIGTLIPVRRSDIFLSSRYQICSVNACLL